MKTILRGCQHDGKIQILPIKNHQTANMAAQPIDQGDFEFLPVFYDIIKRLVPTTTLMFNVDYYLDESLHELYGDLSK